MRGGVAIDEIVCALCDRAIDPAEQATALVWADPRGIACAAHRFCCGEFPAIPTLGESWSRGVG